MHRFALSIVLGFFAGVAASCAGEEGSRSDTDAGGCAPGQQVSCPCPGEDVEGVQICDADGSGFGVCMGCGATSSDGATSLDDDGTTDTLPMDSSGASADEGESSGSPGDSSGLPGGSESGGGLLVWAWVDHGGPAYLPPPCAATAGVVDVLLVDPQAYFMSLVEGTDANDWEAVMNAIEPQLWACGLGQQRGSKGNVRGRLFLPTDACPDASPPPDDPQAIHLGVRQERACWAHFVDVLADA